jgi:hypothetical protein
MHQSDRTLPECAVHLAFNLMAKLWFLAFAAMHALVLQVIANWRRVRNHGGGVSTCHSEIR